jgi:cyanate permease
MEINGKALLWGIAIFVAIYVLHIVLLPSLIGKEAAESENQGLLYAVNQALGLATCLVSGFVAAKKADHHGFVHGAIVGFVSTILTALMAMLGSIVTGAKFAGLATLPFWLVVNGFLCAFAGLLATNMVEDESAE